MSSAAELRGEPPFLEFVKHKAFAGDAGRNARLSLRLIGPGRNLAHRLTRAEREGDKHRVYSTDGLPRLKQTRLVRRLLRRGRGGRSRFTSPPRVAPFVASGTPTLAPLHPCGAAGSRGGRRGSGRWSR